MSTSPGTLSGKTGRERRRSGERKRLGERQDSLDRIRFPVRTDKRQRTRDAKLLDNRAAAAGSGSVSVHASATGETAPLSPSQGQPRTAGETIGVVINVRYGGFLLSDEAGKLYHELSGRKFSDSVDSMLLNLGQLYASDPHNSRRLETQRQDPFLVAVVRQLGSKAGAPFACELVVQDIPIEFQHCFKIIECDGFERLDLSPHHLIAHKLSNADVATMTPDQAKDFLLELKTISSNYCSSS